MIRFEHRQPDREPVRLRAGDAVTLAQLDQLLDVPTSDFERTVTRLVKTFRAKKLSLALPAGEQRVPLRAVGSRGGWSRLYSAQVQALPKMERAEEFAMARRYDFVRARAVAALRETGADDDAARQVLARGRGELPPGASRLRPAAAANLTAALDDYEQLRNLYVEGALYMVLGCVQRYRNMGVDTVDLIQEGNASLFQAIEGFDWRREVRFKTYAQYWIHQALLKVLYNSSRTVRLPVWVQKALTKIRRVAESGRQASGEDPSAESIGAELGMTGDRVRELLGVKRYTMSLDAEMAGDDGATLAQLLADNDAVPVEDSLDDGDLSACLNRVMADLPSRELTILRRRFGLDGKEPETLGEIAADMGITAERVRQLQKAALGRLQRPSKVRQLRAYAG